MDTGVAQRAAAILEAVSSARPDAVIADAHDHPGSSLLDMLLESRAAASVPLAIPTIVKRTPTAAPSAVASDAGDVRRFVADRFWFFLGLGPVVSIYSCVSLLQAIGCVCAGVSVDNRGIRCCPCHGVHLQKLPDAVACAYAAAKSSPGYLDSPAPRHA